MITNEERREIAERLRGGYDTIGAGRYVWLNGTLFGAQICARDEGELRRAIRYIADLIEPSENGECTAEIKIDGDKLKTLVDDAVKRQTGVDRDALLALADEIMRKSDDGMANPDPTRPLASSLDLFGYARRIREAVGA